MVGRELKENMEHYVLTSADYEKGLKEGKLLGLRCKECKQITCPPMIVCQRCGSKELEKTELSGEGELMTFTVIRIPPEDYEAPYIVCIVKTKEGPWIIGRLDYDTEKMSPKLLEKKVSFKDVYAHADKYSGGEHVCPVFEISQ